MSLFRYGRILSALWGLGLSIILFRQVCRGPNCLTIRSTPDVAGKVFKRPNSGTRCVSFSPVIQICPIPRRQAV